MALQENNTTTNGFKPALAKTGGAKPGEFDQEGHRLIRQLIVRQIALRDKSHEEISLLRSKVLVLDRKIRLSKKAIHKAEEHHLDDDKILMVKAELKKARKKRKAVKKLLRRENRNLKIINSLIGILEASLL